MKHQVSLLLTLLLLFVLCLPVYADEAENTDACVIDQAGLLEETEQEELETKAQALSDTYSCGVYIITVDDFTQATSASDIYEAAKELYFSWGFGIGEEESGILLILSMADRDYSIMAHGYGNTAFTDYGKTYLSEQFLDDFADDLWYNGFSDYLSTCETMLSMAKNGTPMDIEDQIEHPFSRLYGVIACVVISLIITTVVTASFKRKMKSVTEKAEASSYVPEGGVVIEDAYDQYTHTTTERIYDPPEKSKGGTTVDSSGSSGQSGKF